MTARRQTAAAAQDAPSLAQRARELSELLEQTRTRSGASLTELCAASAVLLVFLRHTGCPFCREALSDLSNALPALKARGIQPVLVHMGSDERLEALLRRYRLTGLDYITDRSRKLYRAFGLLKSSPFALFSIQTVWRGFQAAVLERHGLGNPDADVFQLPGAFLIDHSLIVRRIRHRELSGRTDFQAFALTSPGRV